MITDQQWNIFRQHVKPNATVKWGTQEGFLLETYPYSMEPNRIWADGIHMEDVDMGLAEIHLNDEGRVCRFTLDELRIQLCEVPDHEHVWAELLEFWVNGEFIEFDQIIALGDVS